VLALASRNERALHVDHALLTLQGDFIWRGVCVYRAEQHVFSGLVAVGIPLPR
jgi:hypothetical protein